MQRRTADKIWLQFFLLHQCTRLNIHGTVNTLGEKNTFVNKITLRRRELNYALKQKWCTSFRVKWCQTQLNSAPL